MVESLQKLLDRAKQTSDEQQALALAVDIVDSLLRAGALESAVGKEFNLASGQETRIVDLANLVNEATGNKAGVQFTQRRKWDNATELRRV